MSGLVCNTTENISKLDISRSHARPSYLVGFRRTSLTQVYVTLSRQHGIAGKGR